MYSLKQTMTGQIHNDTYCTLNCFTDKNTVKTVLYLTTFKVFSFSVAMVTTDLLISESS